MANHSPLSRLIPKSVCARCGELIRRDWALRVDDRLFHTRCQNHLDQFSGGMVNAESAVGAEAVQCCECEETVTGKNVKRVGERIYHEWCLKCARCDQQFTNLVCYRMDDKNYCSKCHLAQKTDQFLRDKIDND